MSKLQIVLCSLLGILILVGIPEKESLASYTAARAPVAYFPVAADVPLPKAKKNAPAPKLAAVPAVLAKNRLTIPSIGLNTSIVKVGLDADGNMAVPTAQSEVGLYKDRTAPGGVGSAVLAAHVYAAFSRLHELNVGDSIYVTNAEGKKLRFVVEETKKISLAQVSAEKLFNRNDARRLNLITCAGTWLPSQATYDHRRVVYAVLAEEVAMR